MPIEYHSIGTRRIVLGKCITKNALSMQGIESGNNIIKWANKAARNDGEALHAEMQSIRNRGRVQKNDKKPGNYYIKAEKP